MKSAKATIPRERIQFDILETVRLGPDERDGAVIVALKQS
jgi:hypothetical protein